MANGMLPTPEELRQLIDYDPETGKLTWRKRFPERTWDWWNRKFAGTPALSARTHARGYLLGMIGGRRNSAHRVAFAWYHGHWPLGDVDHLNGVRDDNRIVNLRECSKSVNARNAAKKKNNSSGITGVCYVTRSKKWRASIRYNGVPHNLGEYPTKDQAAQAYEKAKRHFGGFTDRHGQ